MNIEKMRKLINLVKLYFYNTPVHLNTQLKHLNLYLERFNKEYSFSNKIGRVYKNSKWLNYSIENIKINFINIFLYFILFVIIILSIYMYIYGKDDIKIYLSPLSINGIILNLWYKIFFNILSFFNQTTLFIYYLVYLLFEFANKYLRIKILYFSKVRSTPKVNILKKKTITFSSIHNSIIKLNKINTFLSLYMSNGTFLRTRAGTNTTPYNNTDIYTPFLLKDISFFKYNIFLNKLFYVNNYKLNMFFKKFNFNYFISYNTSSLLNLFKEDKWFLKNNMIDNNIINFLNKNTYTKHLIGVNIYSNTNINNNIWLSNKNSNIHNTEILDNLTLFYKLTYKNQLSTSFLKQSKNMNSIVLYDFFENSVFWLNKKYYFINNINLISTIFNKHKSQSTINIKENNLYILYNINFKLNINNFLENIYYSVNMRITNNSQPVYINNHKLILSNNELLKYLNLKFITNLLFKKKSYNTVTYYNLDLLEVNFIK